MEQNVGFTETSEMRVSGCDVRAMAYKQVNSDLTWPFFFTNKESSALSYLLKHLSA